MRPGQLARGDHRRRRHRHRACRRAASNGARPRRLRPRQDRSREGHQDHAHRGGAIASYRRCPSASSKGVAEVLRGLKVEIKPARAWSRSREGRQARRTATSFPPSSWYGRRASRAPTCSRTSTGWRSAATARLVITETLQTTRDPNIFAFGDCAYLVPKGAKAPVPPRAQAAHQEASHLYVELQRRLQGEPHCSPFHYRDFGSLVSLGEYSTVGSLMGFIVGTQLLRRGAVCAPDVPLALQDARDGAARAGQGHPRHAVARHSPGAPSRSSSCTEQLAQRPPRTAASSSGVG